MHEITARFISDNAHVRATTARLTTLATCEFSRNVRVIAKSDARRIKLRARAKVGQMTPSLLAPSVTPPGVHRAATISAILLHRRSVE